MCQNGIDFRGLMLAVEQLTEREMSLKRDVEAWADFFLEQGATDVAAGLADASETLSKVGDFLARASHDLGHLNEHEHHDHSDHVTVTSFSER